jgi:hypothetical protein
MYKEDEDYRSMTKKKKKVNRRESKCTHIQRKGYSE